MHRRPDGPAWDDSTTWTGSDVRDDAGLWHLFYTGTTLAEKSLYQRIGHATSTDLHNRTLADKIVVLKDGLVQQIGSPMNLHHHPPASGRAKLGLRPQYLNPDDPGGRLHGKVALTERLGSETVIKATLTDGSNLIVALARDAKFPIGTEISLGFDPAVVHLFAA